MHASIHRHKGDTPFPAPIKIGTYKLAVLQHMILHNWLLRPMDWAKAELVLMPKYIQVGRRYSSTLVGLLLRGILGSFTASCCTYTPTCGKCSIGERKAAHGQIQISNGLLAAAVAMQNWWSWMHTAFCLPLLRTAPMGYLPES